MVSYMRSFFTKLHFIINIAMGFNTDRDFEAALESSSLALQNAPFSDKKNV